VARARPTGGGYFATYCEVRIRHTKGRWAGRPLVFEPWQRAFWNEALELDRDGRRVYQEVGLGIPRKNGKSTMAAAAGIYMLDADGEPEPEVYVAAAARNQAGIVMGQSIRMVNASPRLRAVGLVPRTYSIHHARSGGFMRSIAADAPLQHGLNPSANIIDELHAHKSGDLYTALTTGTGAREQPFTLWITTAGVAGAGILGELYGSMFTGPGELEDRGALRIYRDRTNGVLIYWYGASRDDDVDDPAVWTACNPASWRTVDVLAREHARLVARGERLAWQMLNLNMFTGVEESWLPVGSWSETVGAVRLDSRLPIGVGIDRAPAGDSAAIVIGQRQGERVVVLAETFAADATGSVSSEAIRVRLRELRGAFPRPAARDEKSRRPLPGPAFAFDRFAFSESAEILELEGCNMVDFPMTAGTMGPASTIAHELITSGRLVHEADPVLAEQVDATPAILTERGMKVTRPKRGSSSANVAGVALVRAVAMALLPAPPAPSSERLPSAVGF
jgi:phage terminase large subunit-like protein